MKQKMKRRVCKETKRGYLGFQARLMDQQQKWGLIEPSPIAEDSDEDTADDDGELCSQSWLGIKLMFW